MILSNLFYNKGGIGLGKYNLHSLGWKAFETLSGNVMQHILGVTYTPFSEGKDAGRDGYFEGLAGGISINDSIVSGKIAFQCKHSSKSNGSLSLSVVKSEFPKVKRLVEEFGIEHYIILTNRKLTAGNDETIRSFFTGINGLKSCVILGEEWFDLTIDSHPILRKLVPRLYGIGDLSEILDERVYKQSREVLLELKSTVSTFVCTEAYQRALMAVTEKRFVVLLGPPAVGKSAIAANICMSSIAEGDSRETLILENPGQFKKHWNPDHPQKVYWFDDVFGATTLDGAALDEWQSTFLKLRTAIKMGTTVIFTSRDYIFNEAKEKIKESAFPLVFDSQVIINVDDLKKHEKEQMLYNHIKGGDLNKDTKTLLKPHLSHVVGLDSFTPELARRLGNKTFHNNMKINRQSIINFFEKPSNFFKGVISNLDETKQAALVLILLHGNALRSPVRQHYLLDCFKDSYNVSLAQIKAALEFMEGSLVKSSAVTNNRTWSLYHPSMIDSLQMILSTKPEMIEMFIVGADLHTLLRDTTCITGKNHKIFLSPDLWEIFAERVRGDVYGNEYAIARYMNSETTGEFLLWFNQAYKETMEELLDPQFYELEGSEEFELASRMIDLGILGDEKRQEIVEQICEMAIDNFEIMTVNEGFYPEILGEEGIEPIIKEVIKKGPRYFRNEFDNMKDNIDGNSDPDDYFDKWFDSLELFLEYSKTRSLLATFSLFEYEQLKKRAIENIEEIKWPIWDEVEYSRSAVKIANVGDFESISDIFSDVDE